AHLDVDAPVPAGTAEGVVPSCAPVDVVGAAETPQVVRAPSAVDPVRPCRADDVLDRAQPVAPPAPSEPSREVDADRARRVLVQREVCARAAVQPVVALGPAEQVRPARALEHVVTSLPEQD